ncbi:MAG: HAMP domain-containing histidine kinase [Alphaproteobacteria bacterium]|nr:HAMP domain-containing histidine kinase [Alphaproteobacteria bacterium]
MSEALAPRVVRRALGVTAAALLLTGLGTATLLHWRALAALDRTLLSAAEAHTVPHEEPHELDQDGLPRTTPVAFLAPGHPAWAWRTEVDGSPVAVLRQADGVRYLLVDVAARYGPAVAAPLPSRWVVAWAPQVTLATSVGPFAVAYSVLSVVVLAAAAAGLGPLITTALRPLRDATGEVARVVDLSDGTRVREDGPAEIRSLLAAVNALLDRLDRAFSAQARFTADAAHELRTPVAALLGRIEVTLRRPRDDAGYQAALASLHADATHLSQLVAALLDLARLEAGGRPEGHATSLLALARTALDRERDALDRAGVRVQVHDDADAPVRADEALALSALSNLLRNVARHAPGSALDLRVRATGDRAALFLDDDGPGIPEPERERVFERFAHGGTRREGLGLGLSLAREIARRHGGDCTLDASPSGGTRVVWSLPAFS